MKPWMKALVWIGLGGGIGFFSGYNVGYSKCLAETQDEICNLQDHVDRLAATVDIMQKENAPTEDRMAAITERMSNVHEVLDVLSTSAEQAKAAMDEYRGNPEPEEEPEMPMEEPVIDDLEEDPEEEDNPDEAIPDLHPEDITPHPINEDEFNINPKGYDISVLHYYAAEDVIYDSEYDEEMTQDEQLLGIGWFALFGKDPEEGKTIFIENDTMETIYAVHYHKGSIEDNH